MFFLFVVAVVRGIVGERTVGADFGSVGGRYICGIGCRERFSLKRGSYGKIFCGIICKPLGKWSR